MGIPKCKLWLPKKNRFCANVPLSNSPFCGNHTERSDAQWTPCPIDPSHSVLEENLESHLKRCPLLKQVQSLSLQPYYQKGINGGKEEEEEGYQDEETSIAAGFNDFDNPSSFSEENITSEMKRRDLYAMGVSEFFKLISKIKSIHASIRNSIRDSFKIPEACSVWINREVDRKIPFQEKHVMQQASILGNLEELGVLNDAPAVVEFGAGRGYLTQMLADCYGIKKVVLVERKSYKLKADRSLRQKESLILERLRIDIEDLNLNAVDSLQGGVPFLAIGKHLCGPATDMTLRCCLAKRSNVVYPRGLAIATCCHHLCQWKHYINKRYFLNMGIKKEDFHAISWFTSWAVDADHSDDISGGSDYGSHLPISINIGEGEFAGVEEILGKMTATERAILGFMCKDIIDGGRLIWIKEEGLESDFVKYVPSNISPENHLLVAKQV